MTIIIMKYNNYIMWICNLIWKIKGQICPTKSKKCPWAFWASSQKLNELIQIFPSPGLGKKIWARWAPNSILVLRIYITYFKRFIVLNSYFLKNLIKSFFIIKCWHFFPKPKFPERVDFSPKIGLREGKKNEANLPLPRTLFKIEAKLPLQYRDHKTWFFSKKINFFKFFICLEMVFCFKTCIILFNYTYYVIWLWNIIFFFRGKTEAKPRQRWSKNRGKIGSNA